MDSAEIEHLFFTQVPETFCKSLLRAVFTARQLTWDHCQANFPPQESDNVRPWYARGKIESLMRESAERVGGMSTQVVRTPKSAWNHTEIVSGSVLLTAAAVQQPCGPVNRAEFRVSLAASNQGLLFDSARNGTMLYTLLLHSSYHAFEPNDRQKFGYLPGSAYIAFPASDLEGYLHGINLFDRYPEIVADNYPTEWDNAARVHYLYNARKASWPA